VLAGYVRSANLFKEHAGADLLWACTVWSGAMAMRLTPKEPAKRGTRRVAFKAIMAVIITPKAYVGLDHYVESSLFRMPWYLAS
jgi:hypothetical protein